MEAKTKDKKAPGKSTMMDAYRDYVLTEGKNPSSVYQLGKMAGFTEAAFYAHFSSIARLESEIWLDHLEEITRSVKANPEYNSFSGRDKLLLFFFSMVQQLRKDRSFICWSAASWAKPGKHSAARKAVAEKVKDYFSEVLGEASASGEIKERTKISNHYADALLLSFWFILDFWIKDESRDFEDSDALIEKTIGLALDLLGESPLEKALDLGKFLIGRLKKM